MLHSHEPQVLCCDGMFRERERERQEELWENWLVTETVPPPCATCPERGVELC